MPNKYWFKPKKYGYGFTPISWEGWLATLFLVGLILLSARSNNFFTSEISTAEGFGFLLSVIALTVLFSLLSKRKIKGKLGWRWGDKKSK